MSSTRLEVSTYDGKVKLDLGAEGGYAVLEPPLAVQIAKAMIDAAEECGYTVTLQVPPRKISDKQRTVLTTRAAHIMRSMEGRPQTYIAQHVVDSILAEVA